jgi:hypothetical protein
MDFFPVFVEKRHAKRNGRKNDGTHNKAHGRKGPPHFIPAGIISFSRVLIISSTSILIFGSIS